MVPNMRRPHACSPCRVSYALPRASRIASTRSQQHVIRHLRLIRSFSEYFEVGELPPPAPQRRMNAADKVGPPLAHAHVRHAVLSK